MRPRTIAQIFRPAPEATAQTKKIEPNAWLGTLADY